MKDSINAKPVRAGGSPTRRRIAVLVVVGHLFLSALAARAWEVGVIGTVINYAANGGDTAHGASLLVREEVFKYFDIGARTGYMRSDPMATEYFNVGLSLSVKYPFFDEHFVPFIAVMGSLQFYSSDFRNSHASTPFWGADFRFGERRQWSVYCEGLYQIGHAHRKSDDTAFQFEGLGGSLGLSYRF